jgi:hypothetical protein
MRNIIIKDERNHLVISGNAISILDKLPASIFELVYNSEKGFSLNEADSFFRNSEKLYGEAETITKKVLSVFDTVKGNLGVLFSGPKGLGKSLTVRNICKEAIKKGLPVILVREHFENITPFIETICQPSVVVFDEFEKIYRNNYRTEKNELEGQDSLLNLFDSSLECKKLFLLTCNDVRNLSEYLLNRPGRLHYHFRMQRLSINEITEYCTDNLGKENYNLISDICSLGARIPDFSYDMLRSIVFELNICKCGLVEVRKFLNIDAKAKSPFNYTICFKSGKTETGFDYIDTADSRLNLYWYGKSDGNRERVTVNMTEVQWTGNADGSLYLDRKHIYRQQEEKRSGDHIEKIIFIPAKEGYLSSENNWD